MNIKTEKVKGTPFKVLLSDSTVIGIFEKSKGTEIFVEKKNLNYTQLRAIKSWEK
jgi:hypothetical protein